MRLKNGKGFSTVFLVIFLILTCGAFMYLKIVTDRIPRKKIPGSSIIYLPEGKYLKYATFGHSALLADLIYIWAIQYYSDYEIPDSYDYLYHIFEIIAELDPHYFDPIDMGAFIAAYEALDADLAVKILDMGLEKNPKEWFFPYQAAHYIQFMQKDYERVQEYYKKTMSIEGYPPIVKRLYAHAIFKAQDYQRALEEWLELYNTAEDERVKQVASNHLYNIRANVDIEKLQEAIAKFKEKYSRYPADLSRLVSAGFLDSIPKDMDDKEYLYDSQTGEVKPPTIPWKR